MTREKFEMILGNHCAPVLFEMKPANLVSFSQKDAPELPEYLREYEAELLQRGIHTELICSCRKHYLLLVYRPALLARTLMDPEICGFLQESGYELSWTLMQKIRFLHHRFEAKTGVPHEVGAFLGYPIEDIRGFCKYKGANAKLCGYWKVYGDPVAAQKLFTRFDESRRRCNAMQQQGYSIIQVVDQCA